MSSPVVERGISGRRRARSLGTRRLRRLGPLTVGLLLQTAVGCDPSATLAALQQDAVNGIGAGIGSLAQFLVLNLFV